MHKIRHLTTPLVLVAALGLSTPRAEACAFHTYLPQQSMVDQLLATENVVLARPDPEDPFRFKAVTALEGTLEQADLPTLVDSSTRRRLALNPEDTVLFARDGGGYGPFLRLAYVDSAYREIVETIMSRKEDWVMGDDLGRYQYFADLLATPDYTIRNLALRELDTAPYDLLRALDLHPDADAILRDIWRVQEAPYAPIRILLLGFSDSEAARAVIRHGLETRRDSASLVNLGPFATALVELDGAAGVAQLEALFLTDPATPAAVQELVVEALAIHAGAADPEMRDLILASLAAFGERHPDRADSVARQFQTRYDFGMTDALATLLESGRIRTAKVLIPVSTYVLLGRQETPTATEIQ